MAGDRRPLTTRSIAVLRLLVRGSLVQSATSREIAENLWHRADGRAALQELRSLAADGLVAMVQPARDDRGHWHDGYWQATRSGRELVSQYEATQDAPARR